MKNKWLGMVTDCSDGDFLFYYTREVYDPNSPLCGMKITDGQIIDGVKFICVD